MITIKTPNGGDMNHRGVFNYCGEITELYRHAGSEAQALNYMHRQLAKKYDTSPARIRGYFNGKADNYRVTKI